LLKEKRRGFSVSTESQVQGKKKPARRSLRGELQTVRKTSLNHEKEGRVGRDAATLRGKVYQMG